VSAESVNHRYTGCTRTRDLIELPRCGRLAGGARSAGECSPNGLCSGVCDYLGYCLDWPQLKRSYKRWVIHPFCFSANEAGNII